MINDLRITVLVENTARGINVLSEHGLAFWIEADGCHILFDTGQGGVLCHNAQCLGIPLHTAEMVAISHGHFDHTGGLSDALVGVNRTTAAGADLFLHPDALNKKYAKEKMPPHREIGIPRLDENDLRKRARKLVFSTEPTQLMKGVYLTGRVPRRNDYEDTGGPFYLDQECTEPDPLLDDQALYIETPVGTVVVLGCAHSGVVNTLDYITDLTGRDHIHAVMGGMHLGRATSQRLLATSEVIRRYGIKKIGTAHCTGAKATSYLWSQFPDECFECCVGATFRINQ
ncbi:MAG: MBL fold metallo-hydrolase [Pirellulales bacterium]|nr:MBL fold metallo-hydrolase [Pirellulales bacterium]